MSEQATHTEDAIEFPHRGDVAFNDLMDALAPSDDPANEAGAQDFGREAAQGSGNAAVHGTGDPTSNAGATPYGNGGYTQAQGATEATGATAGDAGGAAEQQPAGSTEGAVGAGWTLDADAVMPQIYAYSTALEERLGQAYNNNALQEVRQEYGKYFEALGKHPRMLVGTEVPSMSSDGMEILRDTEDAREWQGAVKEVLTAEIQQRAQNKYSQARDFIETLHASIDIFKNNKDLVPGTKNFDRQLADAFAQMAQPYELRVDGKLHGYSIPVQPIIDKLRGQLHQWRKTQQTASTPPTPQATRGRPRAAAPPTPQATIQSRAGSSAEKEDFSTLFGTIGLPNLQI